MGLGNPEMGIGFTGGESQKLEIGNGK